ncbi:MAG TPA: protein kinase [Gemmatimonadaceae bacterium]|nr:protein kinase [Gemmatimonadaceae bacterium]
MLRVPTRGEPVAPSPGRDELQAALGAAYRIERELGRGGMAAVHLAHDLKHDRPVAVKVLHPEIAAAMGAERFLREITIAAQLQHPHILPLHDSGHAHGLFYYVMPYVEGESLRERLARQRQLPVDEAARIAREVADALAYAHARGIVHRDIKPENILLSYGHALVTDFGIARALAPSPRAAGLSLTEPGFMMGTPAYMSPEQASGDAVDGRSDIYSLGCVLYEMLAGEAPFTGPTPQAAIARRFTATPTPLRTLRAAIPGTLERAVGRMLERVPADRFADAAELARALAVPDEGPGRAAPPRSIAVLPFASLSADREDEFFGDGLAEELLNALVKAGPLRVASRTSSFAFRGRSEDIREIGRQLGVATVLEGSVRRAGSRIRITAQLIDATTGHHLWSERYDRELADVFAVQDDIAASIVRELRVVLGEGECCTVGPAPAEFEAYEYFLRGRQLFHQLRRRSQEHALEMFRRAIEVDPHYARAYAGIADCCSMKYMYFEASEEALRCADEASRKALELEPGLAEAHVSRGLAISLRGDYEAAEPEFQAALRLNPRLFEAHYFFARNCLSRGLLEEAAAYYAEAERLRPDDVQVPGLLATALFGLGREEEALAAIQRLLAAAERHLELYPDDARALYFAAGAHARLGDREGCLELAARALAVDASDPGILYNVACTYAIIGEHDRALDALEAALRNGFAHRQWMEHDPDLDGLRVHPRFRAALAALAGIGTGAGATPVPPTG